MLSTRKTSKALYIGQVIDLTWPLTPRKTVLTPMKTSEALYIGQPSSD